jgi:hypothetical protein
MKMNYLTAKAQARRAGGKGLGVFAREPIAAGEAAVAFGGYVVTRDELESLGTRWVEQTIQIEDDLFLVGPESPEPADRVNHSCEPNCGLLGASVLVAMRDIAAGEELTYDYATSDSADYDEFACECGSALCREKVTGRDWMLPELQRRYRGWFSPYLARRIGAMTTTGASRRVFAA